MPRGFVFQMLMFPTWEFEHEGFLTAFEFVTQELQQPAQVRLQVHRPAGGEGSVSSPLPPRLGLGVTGGLKHCPGGLFFRTTLSIFFSLWRNRQPEVFPSLVGLERHPGAVSAQAS